MGLHKQKQIGLFALVFIGLAALYAGFVSFPGKLIAPFHLLPPGASGVDLNKDAKEQARLLALKVQDTDSDGLFDYDELYLYKTSPYLEDSDSDGFKDKEEIDNGFDPNCPKDQDCRIFAGSLEQGGATSGGELTRGLLGASGIGTEGGMPDFAGQAAATAGQGSGTAAGAGLDLGAMTPDQLRTLLKQNGFAESELAKLDDATLLEVWRSTLAQQGQAEATGNQGSRLRSGDTVGTSDGQAVGSQSAVPSATELRKALLDAGMDAQALEKISDTELLEMYNKVVKK